ncbi:MAG TPA: GIY-YIG nuclease family protein [Nitrospirae bacterium]|nr:GIY-YIG nuclease family protein [Nitrospirota bacterium]
MFYVYILQNPAGRFYIGHSNDLDRRISQHNDPHYTGTRTTKRFPGPWTLVYHEEYRTRSEAMKREKQLKHIRNREVIQKIISSAGRVPRPRD